jgi:hypothetical protein
LYPSNIGIFWIYEHDLRFLGLTSIISNGGRKLISRRNNGFSVSSN